MTSEVKEGSGGMRVLGRKPASLSLDPRAHVKMLNAAAGICTPGTFPGKWEARQRKPPQKKVTGTCALTST